MLLFIHKAPFPAADLLGLAPQVYHTCSRKSSGFSAAEKIIS